jgi:type II secretion system protein J
MKDKKGVTFVELIVAVSIFAVVSVAVYSTFAMGLSVWRRARNAQALYQNIRLALDEMARDLQNAVAYFDPGQPTAINFEGEKDRISFYSLVDGYQTTPPYPQLRKVSYTLGDSGSLQRLEQVHQGADIAQESEAIASQVANLSFFYCYEDTAGSGYEWKQAWELKQEIPESVKIELELNTGNKPVFSKYVFIPTGKKGP